FSGSAAGASVRVERMTRSAEFVVSFQRDGRFGTIWAGASTRVSAKTRIVRGPEYGATSEAVRDAPLPVTATSTETGCAGSVTSSARTAAVVKPSIDAVEPPFSANLSALPSAVMRCG